MLLDGILVLMDCMILVAGTWMRSPEVEPLTGHVVVMTVVTVTGFWWCWVA